MVRNYRQNAATSVRTDYGVALIRGLSNFETTRPHATAFKTLNDELDTQHETRRRLRKPWLEARQDVRFCDWNADQAIRSFKNICENADGGKAGPITAAVFSDGLTPFVAPSGARQLPAIEQLIDRVEKSRHAGIIVLRDAELPKLHAARTQLAEAVTAYTGARRAYNEAFAVEKAMRDEHRLAVFAMMGTVQSLFPDDRARQDLIFPDATVSRGVGDGDGDDTDTDTDPGNG